MEQHTHLNLPQQQRQKRARSQLSCDPCRIGKLKCSRTVPCDQCEKRSKSSACTYPPPAKKARRENNVKGRIRHLEQLVVDLMNAKTSNEQQHNGSIASDNNAATRAATEDSSIDHGDSRGTTTQLTPPDSEKDYAQWGGVTKMQQSEDDQTSSAFGQLKIKGGETSYVGSTHWASILDGISDLKRELDETDDDEVDADEINHGNSSAEESPLNSRSLLRSPLRLTKTELIQAMPPKSVVDPLVSLWFNSPDPFKLIIHQQQFEKEYRQFWKDPQNTPTMWLGLLYAIMSTGCFFHLQVANVFSSPKAHSLCAEIDKYHDLSAAAIVLAEYTVPKAFAIETLLIYTGIWRTRSAFMEVWLLLGVIVRLGLRMGFHRDGSHYGKLSPYTCEMRRRTYTVLYMADTITSFQIGLPGMLRTVQSDTQPPHNLLDRDFDIHSTVLPPERPNDEFTPSAYASTKISICRVFSDAVELSHMTTPPSYAEVMDVDARVEHARSKIPDPLRARATEMSVIETAGVIFCCISLDILYLKTKCVLHRRFMGATASESAQPYSHKACVESAMQILRHHHTMVAASKPGGRLESAGWYIGHFSKADFLMAAMLICVELGQYGKGAGEIVVPREVMIDALEKTKAIWDEVVRGDSAEIAQGQSIKNYTANENSVLQETVKACRAMDAMLRMVRARDTDGATEQLPQNGLAMFSSESNGVQLPPQGAASTELDDLSSFQTMAPETLLNTDGVQDVPMFDDMIGDVENIDWATWDQHFGGPAQQQPQDDLSSWSVDEILAAGTVPDDDGFGINPDQYTNFTRP